MSQPMNPIKGLYAVTPDLADTALLVSKVQIALSAGTRLLQYRNKTVDGDTRQEQAQALLDLCRHHGVTLIINDNIALACALDADGVHVGRDDVSVRDARARMGRGKIVGASCYDDIEKARVAATDGADYVAFGSFFASSVKPGALRPPLSLLTAARALDLPVVAIGGITLDNARPLIDSGADAVAVISALFGAHDIGAATRGFCGLFQGNRA
jgi:thiamine-phosphate pyrophosphorylase